MNSYRIEPLPITKIRAILTKIPKVTIKGKSVPSYHEDAKVHSLRLIQPDMVLLTDLPRELMNDTVRIHKFE